MHEGLTVLTGQGLCDLSLLEFLLDVENGTGVIVSVRYLLNPSLEQMVLLRNSCTTVMLWADFLFFCTAFSMLLSRCSAVS